VFVHELQLRHDASERPWATSTRIDSCLPSSDISPEEMTIRISLAPVHKKGLDIPCGAIPCVVCKW